MKNYKEVQVVKDLEWYWHQPARETASCYQQVCYNSNSLNIFQSRGVSVWHCKGSVFSVFPRDFCGEQHLHRINVRVAIPTTSGIAGSSKDISSQATSVGMHVTGGDMQNMILRWPNRCRTMHYR